MKLAPTLVALVLLGNAVVASAAVSTDARFDVAQTYAQKIATMGSHPPHNPPQTAVGGDNIGNATVIPSIPYIDTGNTCSYTDDYTEFCPFDNTGTPDVVYSYTPAVNQSVDIDLCPSGYDTQVYVYENAAGNLIACNDDAGAGCGPDGFRSRLLNVSLTAGNTYYIVVDGFVLDCGDYYMDIHETVPCGLVVCKPTGIRENEPVCHDGYVDNFNGGCNSSPPVYSEITLTPGNPCPQICGEAGTYIFDGQNYRDTDWYRVTIGPGVYTVTGISDGFDLRLFTLDNNCPPTIFSTVAVPPCTPGSLNLVGPGTFVIFAGTNVFDGVACGSDYVLYLYGPQVCQPVPTATSSWGKLKTTYR